MNNWSVTGRLTKEPETNALDQGNMISIFYIAVKREFKNKSTNEYESDYFRFKAFGRTADYIHTYIKKGDLVEIESRPTNNNYEKDGKKIYQDDYIVKNINKLATPKGESNT
jgi:single-strand DNA-binding protein